MLSLILDINNAVKNAVWGMPALILIFGTGLYYSVSLKFFQLRYARVWLKHTFGCFFNKKNTRETSGISSYKASATALASTIGTGNIVGVATAIVAGGPGAVFWIWVSAFFGTMIKYSEILLAVCFRQKDKNGKYFGGPMYYIEQGLGQGFKWLSVIFCVFAVFSILGTSNLNQSNSIAAAAGIFGVKPIFAGLAAALITSLVIVRGIKGIANVSAMLVPFMACFYIAGALYTILAGFNSLANTFMLIFRRAFSLNAAGGGIAGYTMMNALKTGFSRAVFSNEAGLGTASIVHAAADAGNPVKEGFWGIFEVFVDTMVVCSLTAIAIINSGLYASGLNGAALCTAVFSKHLGGAGGLFLSLSIIMFALSTVLSMYYYGEQCLFYLFHGNKKVSDIYKIIYLLLIIVGSECSLTFVWSISDTLNGLLIIPNLIAVISLSDIVICLTKRYLKNEKR